MPQTPEITDFLITLRTPAQTTNTQQLEERATVAVAKLSADAKAFITHEYGCASSVLHYAVKENNPYFVKALLDAGFNHHYLMLTGASNPLAFISHRWNADTVAIIKYLKANNADINLPINAAGLRAFNSLTGINFYTQRPEIQAALASELLPSILLEEDFKTIVAFDPTLFIALYTKFQNQVTPDVLAVIYSYAASEGNYRLLQLDQFKSLKLNLDALVNIIHSLMIQPNLTNPECKDLIQSLLQQFFEATNDSNDSTLQTETISYAVNRLLIAFNRKLISFFPDELIKDSTIFNVAVAKLTHPIFSVLTRSYAPKKPGVANEHDIDFREFCNDMITFLFNIFNFIEQVTHKTFDELNINCEKFLAEVHAAIKKEQDAAMNLMQKQEVGGNQYSRELLLQRGHWIVQFFPMHLLCDSRKYSHFFLRQLYCHAPEILAELMHVGNPEFNLFLFDKVNQIAIQEQEKGNALPSVVKDALRAQKSRVLQLTPLQDLVPTYDACLTTRRLSTDIVKHIINFASPDTLLTFARYTPKMYATYYKNDQYGHALWLTQRKQLLPLQILIVNYNSYLYWSHQFQNIKSKIAATDNKNLAMQLQNFVFSRPLNITSDELFYHLKQFCSSTEIKEIAENITKFFKIVNYYTANHKRFEDDYLSCYLPTDLSADAQEKVHQTHVPNLFGFWALVQRKEKIMQFISKISVSHNGEPTLKKQKLN